VIFDIPGPQVHSAVVLRNGVRYVGHLTATIEEYVASADVLVSLTVDEGSRVIQIVGDEVAAIETFPGRSVTGCRGCQPARERLGGR
jgi:hypothetical protein